MPMAVNRDPRVKDSQESLGLYGPLQPKYRATKKIHILPLRTRPMKSVVAPFPHAEEPIVAVYQLNAFVAVKGARAGEYEQAHQKD